MLKKEEDQKNKYLTAREEKEIQLRKAQEEREYEMFVKKEMELIKREDRLENVERIARANQYH